MPKLTGLTIHPVASCRGIAVTQAELTPSGLRYDRHFVLVNEKGAFLSQRVLPRMCLIHTALFAEDKTLMVTDSRRPENQLQLPLEEFRGPKVSINIWDKRGYGIDMGNIPALWFTAVLGINCRLLGYDPWHARRRGRGASGIAGIPLTFQDGFPGLVISEESLIALNGRLKRPVSMRRFRPNLVVRGVPKPYAEDDWNFLSTKECVFAGEKPCERCSIINIDPETGIVDPEEEPMKTLKHYRRLIPEGAKTGPVIFGKNLSVIRPGILRVGEEIFAN